MVKRFVSIFMVAIVLSMFCFSVIAEGPSSEAEVASSTSEDAEEIIGVGVIEKVLPEKLQKLQVFLKERKLILLLEAR